MTDWVLPLFPEGGLSSSIVTTIWVGVCVVVFLNLRFGWVLSGLVVPGYMTPLLILKPWAALTIATEGLVTYAILILFSEKLAPRLNLTNLFGRDRFFALLLISVLVRMVFDAWLLPTAAEYFIDTFNVQFDYRSNLHSFGLIIVALIANQLWKPGLLRGSLQLGVSVVLCFLIVRYILIDWTNFSFSSLHYMYEDLATSLLASPKGYIILLTTAFIASRMNLLYGWEFNGILIPSLLALQWYQPMKLIATFIEVFFILIIASQLFKSPLFKSATIEGGRKILLFFNISFFYKFCLSYAIIYFVPTLKISDYYGFGYILPSLLALKMHDKDIAPQITRATIQSSLTALIVASGIGFSLSLLPQLFSVQSTKQMPFDEANLYSEKTLGEVIEEHTIHLYSQRRPESYKEPLINELQSFSESLQRLKRSDGGAETNTFLQVQQSFASVHFDLQLVEDRYWVIQEKLPSYGWGLFIMDTQATSDLLIEVPYPLSEWALHDSGFEIMRAMGARYLSISGTGKRTNHDGTSDMLLNRASFMHVFQNSLKPQSVLQLRGYTASLLRKTSKKPVKVAALEKYDLPNTLWIQRDLPKDLNLQKLERVLGEIKLEWRHLPIDNTLRESRRDGYAELVLNRKTRRNLFFEPVIQAYTESTTSGRQRIDGYLHDWLLSGRNLIAEKNTNDYIQPSFEELLFIDNELLTPLFTILNEYKEGQWSEEGKLELQSLYRTASMVGYKIIQYHENSTDEDFLIITEQETLDTLKHWGTLVIRLGASSNHIIEVPRPLFELNVFEFGVSLFEVLNARMLLISGTHPMANIDGSSDILKVENKSSFYNLVHQVIFREIDGRPLLPVICRAFGYRAGQPVPEADALIALHSGHHLKEGKNQEVQELVDRMHSIGISTSWVMGNRVSSGYEVGNNQFAKYLKQTIHDELAILWLSPLTRLGYRQQDDNELQRQQFQLLGMPTRETDLVEYLNSFKSYGEISGDFKHEVQQYLETNDIIGLQRLKSRYEQYSYERVIDIHSKQALLLVLDEKSNSPILLANLFPRGLERTFTYDREDRGSLNRFLESHAPWLVFTKDDEL